MNTDTKANLLNQALEARSSGNSSLLIQCLQQLILGEKVIPPSQDTPPVSESEVKPLFDLALGTQQETKESTPVAESEQFFAKEATRTQLLDLAIEVLVSGDFHDRWDIAKVFPKLGESAIAPLLEIMEDEEAEEELRWYAARILGEFNHPSVIVALVELLKTSDDEELTAMAAAALGNIGSMAVAALTELLTDENTRLLAVRSLSHIRRSETIAPLLSVVADSQSSIRTAAIEALSSFHNSQIPPILLNALDDTSASVRREAVVGLSFRPDLREELDLVNRLLPRLYDFNLDVCTAAAIALGRLGTDNGANALYQVLQSPHTPLPLQTEIVRALGRVGTITSLEYLHSCLNQQLSVKVWQETVTVLGRVEQPELKTKAAQILIEMLKSSHGAIQHESVREKEPFGFDSLLMSPPTQTVSPCNDGALSDDFVKSAIALSLGQLGEMQAIKPLIQLLADTDAGVRLHVIAALKQLAPELAYQQLEQLVIDTTIAPNLKQGVAIALTEWSMAS